MRFKGIWLILLLLITSLNVSAQTDVSELMRQGGSLANDKKFTEAADKYKNVLAVDANNAKANYQLALVLFSSGKGVDGVPYLQSAVKNSTDAKFTAAAYSLLGSIYSVAKQLPKAIEAYNNGIKADSSNQRIYYNLGIAYYMAKQYTNAGQSFITAIKIDTTDVGSTRMYALAAFHQNKRAEALLGFCRFLLLEPNTARSAEAFANLQNILQGGQLKPEPGYKPTTTDVAEATGQNLLVKKALTPFAGRKYASPADLLAAQLSAIFKAINAIPGNKISLSGYFAKLAQTDYMLAFAHYISQSAMPASIKWVKDNSDKIKALE